MNYLHYTAISRIVKFEIPKYLENLIGIVIDKFNESGISTVDMLQYMLDNDINNWIHYYAYTFIIPVAKGEENEAVNDLSELYAFVLMGYILDTFREKRIDIKNLVEGQVLAHKTNHIDENTADKLLLVVKKKVDNNSKKDFWHIELETLPYRDTASKGKYCITTFLHGMYYPEDDYFTHIDCTDVRS